MQPGTYKIIYAGKSYLLDIDIDDGSRTIDLEELPTAVTK